MKYEILISTPAGFVDDHDSFWIDADHNHDGTLTISKYDETGDLTGEKVYARGFWLSYELIDGPSEEAVALKAEMERKRYDELASAEPLDDKL